MTKEKKRVTDKVMALKTVQYWQSTLRDRGLVHAKANTSTKRMYLWCLAIFDAWLTGRVFDVRTEVIGSGRIIYEDGQKAFANVEEMLRFAEENNTNVKETNKMVRTFVMDECNKKRAFSSMTNIICAIKSYFDAHEVILRVKFSKRMRDKVEVTEPRELTIPEFYKMITCGKVNPLMRAVAMVKFQAGLDSSTLADRFNYQACAQIAKWCGPSDYRSWDPEKCPIQIQLVRVKTGVAFTTFIDRDALTAIKDYFSWWEKLHGPRDFKGPMFLSLLGEPISVSWTSNLITRIANTSGVQKKLSEHCLKITSHEVRDLLKSTLMACKCPTNVADHIIGHKRKDSYEKQSELYPETLRSVYALASHMLNIFSHAEAKVKDTTPPGAIKAELEDSRAETAKLRKDMRELKLANEAHKDNSKRVNDKFDRFFKALSGASDKFDDDFFKDFRDSLFKP